MPAVDTAPPEVQPRETTDQEDIEALAADIVTLAQTAAYNDMTWAEFDAAMRLASLQIKVNWTATGSVMPAP